VLEPTKPSDDSSATSSEDQVRETRDVGDSDDELEEESPKQTQRTGRLLVYQVSSDQTNLWVSVEDTGYQANSNIGRRFSESTLPLYSMQSGM
jgi:hypothetical protein